MEMLAQYARRFGWILTGEQIAAFRTYGEELVAWNERVNLTSITGAEAIQIKHFLDSLTCLLAFPPAAGLHVIDVGSGAGFPGLPIRIVRPDVRLTLLEAAGKKVAFLRHVTACLGFGDVTILQGRAEEWARQPEQREQYDVVLARAVAELRVLAEYTLPFCRMGGVVIAQKSAAISEEINSAAKAITILGGALRTCLPIELPGVEPRQLVILDKVAATPPIYPRRVGMPEKRPL